MFDATFWVAISFVIFCLIIVYKKIPQVINNLLDNKINEIKSEIDNAKNLKNESEQLLKKYKNGGKLKTHLILKPVLLIQ